MRHGKRDQIFIICASVFFIVVGWRTLNRRGASSNEGDFYRKSETVQDQSRASGEPSVSDASDTSSGGENERRASSADEQAGFVHVAGAIRHPGIYPFSEGERIGDAIEKAGGLTENASAENINLAQRLVDEMQIRIPVQGAGDASGQSEAIGADSAVSSAPGELSVTVPAQGARLNLNTATAEQLQALPSIGPKRAQEIVDRREAKPFQSVEELLEISGIGTKTLEKLRDLVMVR